MSEASGTTSQAAQPSQQLFSLDTEFKMAEDDLAPAATAVAKAPLHTFRSVAHHAQCPVCGDQITGNHYGVNTCESCKGFFKRTKKSKSALKCVNGRNSCPMTIEGRKLCSKCRYDKCLAVGMCEGVKSRLVANKEGRVSETYLPSMMSTRTRTIKRRYIDYNDDEEDEESEDVEPASSSKRPNNTSVSSSERTVVTLDQAKEAPAVECPYCLRDLSNLNAYNRRTHTDHCKFRDKTSCIYCLTTMAELSAHEKRAHISECRVTHNNQVHKDAREEKPSGTKTGQQAKKTAETDQSDSDSSERPEDLDSSVNEDTSPKRAPSTRLKARRDAESTPPSPPRPSKAASSSFVKCRGYTPEVAYSDGSSIYSNFPFQAIDFDAENIKFVMENGVFHNHNCAKRDYRLASDSRDQCNRFCSDLMYNKYLQNIVKRSQIEENFSSVPHIYLTFNQLKKELNHYRENIKKLKLDNLNLKRTIESLRSKEDNYKRFVHLLAQKDYAKLNQIITVCLNQKKGINGIIDKLLDTMEGVYQPREREVMAFQAEDVECKICADKVSLFKMREHVAGHLRQQDVPEEASRCGFCGLAHTCSVGIKVTKCKGDKGAQAFWPVSDCAYFKNFNLKMSNKPCKGLLASNRPIECHLCKKVVWSFNVRAHFSESHLDAEPPELLTDDESAAVARAEDVTCKVCREPVGLAKMRDHVTKHLLFKEVAEDENTCGFCGLVGCSIEIRVTSGKGKNTTYGPHSNCPYFRKFNLKSSTRPTKSSPSTNRPIECHICKSVFWSYNVKCHFVRQHPEESAPELITELEREMVARS